jgi:hypothetical protein
MLSSFLAPGRFFAGWFRVPVNLFHLARAPLCSAHHRDALFVFSAWQPLREAYLHALKLSFRFFRTPLFWEALDRDAFSTQGPFLVLSHRFHEVSTTGGIGI